MAGGGSSLVDGEHTLDMGGPQTVCVFYIKKCKSKPKPQTKSQASAITYFHFITKVFFVMMCIGVLYTEVIA